MKFWKRLLSLTMLLLMLASLVLCFPAVAEESETDEEESEEEEDPKLDTAPYLKNVYGSVDSKIATMTKGITAYGMTFYYDPLSGEVAIKNEETGTYLLTNPYDASSAITGSQGNATDSIKQQLLSQIIITYTENDKESEMNSFKDAAIDFQISCKQIRGGYRFEYTLGREEERVMVPRRETKDRFEENYLVPMQAANPSDAKRFESFYLLKDPNDPTLSATIKLQILRQLPITEKFPVYVIDPSITQSELLRIEAWVKAYTTVTYEFIDEGHALTEYTGEDKEPALFKLALEYTLSESGLSVNLSAKNIRFNSTTYKLKNVTLLPYMGAGKVYTTTTTNKGYVFTPDGSGTLISFEDIKGKNVTVTDKLYGLDYAFHNLTDNSNREQMRMPVFGIYQYNKKTIIDQVENEEGIIETVERDASYYSGFMSIIEEGDSLADIVVKNGGATHNYVSVYTTFNPRPSDTYSIDAGIGAGTGASWTVSSKRKYTGNYKLQFIMLYGDDASYAGMARKYREYLISKGVLEPLQDDNDDIPLYLETLGALTTTGRILGIPVDQQTALTSFDDTKEIIDRFNTKGITNLKIKMTGWANEGMSPTVPTSIDVEKVLGDEDGFAELLAYAKEKGVTLYPDIDFVYVGKDGWFDGFSSKSDSVKTIDNRSAVYRTSSLAASKLRNIFISPRVVSSIYDKAYEDYSLLNVGGISVSTLGTILNSDFYRDDPLNREDSKRLYTRLMAKIEEQNNNVMISGGNAYMLAYVDDITDVALEDSRSIYSMASVPFMGMVLHGYVSFSGSALNLAGDYQYTLLKTIENGAVPYFVVARQNTSELKTSKYTEYYSVRYSIWEQDIQETYLTLNSLLKDVKYSPIYDHEFLDTESRVVKVTFENGIAFYINYLLKDYTYEVTNEDGEVVETIVIPSEGYVKVNAAGEIVAKS